MESSFEKKIFRGESIFEGASPPGPALRRG
jgi:hypothetical protein